MTDAPSRKSLYLIDGHAQFFRAYYAIRSGMTSPVTGEPTNMTYGFVGMLLKLLRDYKPDYLAVAIDVSGDRESFRSQLYEHYKANRKEAPEDLGPQIRRCLKIMELMQIPVVGEPGVEADDVIATIVRRLQREQPDLHIRIVSRDKDLAQLLSDHVELFDVHKDEAVTAADVFGVDGLEPKHVADLLTLVGDTVDNIPGVPGIGPKTAGQLILHYGSLDNLLDHLDEIKGKRRESIEASRAQLAIGRQLVQLKEDVDVELDLNAAQADPAQLPADELMHVFRELGFGRYPDELRKLTGYTGEVGMDAPMPAPAVAGRKADPIDDGLFASVEQSDAAPRDPGRHEIIKSIDALQKLVHAIRSAGQMAVDTETDGLATANVKLCGVSVAVKPKQAFYIPTCSPEPQSHLTTEQVLEVLRPVLEDESIRKVGHNLKFDINVLRSHGVQLRGIVFDTMIASYVLDATRSSHKLEVLALALLNHTCIPIRELIGSGRKQLGFDEAPLARAADYAAEDADVTLRLYEHMLPQLEEAGLRKLFDTVELPLVETLADMEWNGFYVDADELDHQREELQLRIDDLRRQILALAPHPFSPDSPRQLAAALFNKPTQDPPGLGLKVLRRGKTGPSTDQEVLEKIAADPEIDSPLPKLILEYRQLTKLVNTYLVALKQAINPRTHRVHASFNQTVAETGRLSASDPNLQNIPIRTEVGRRVRRAFQAEPGNVLITADYSQIELRILAHLSKDPALINAFRQGRDIHIAVAAEVYGVAPEQVTPAQRDSAKMVNFGIVYGITPYGLARRLGPEADVQHATQIILNYKKRFSRIEQFLQECIDSAMTRGYVETILGRRRAITAIHSRNRQQRALGERMAINSVVQGSAADLIKVAMINLHRALPKSYPAVKLVLQIHDELVYELPRDQVAQVQPFVVDHMEHAMELDVPLAVESAWSESWMDVK